MKPKASLRAVLTIRERQERLALESYAAGLRRVRQTQEQLAAAEAACVAAFARARALLSAGGNAADIHLSGQYCGHVERQRLLAAGECRTARDAAEQARQQMLYRR